MEDVAQVVVDGPGGHPAVPAGHSFQLRRQHRSDITSIGASTRARDTAVVPGHAPVVARFTGQ